MWIWRWLLRLPREIARGGDVLRSEARSILRQSPIIVAKYFLREHVATFPRNELRKRLRFSVVC